MGKYFASLIICVCTLYVLSQARKKQFNDFNIQKNYGKVQGGDRH